MNLHDKENIPQPLSAELQLLESSARNFGMRFAMDNRSRRHYNRTIAAMSQEIYQEFLSGKYTVIEAAEKACGLRNELMMISRQHSSDVGRAKATKLKPDPVSFTDLKEDKSKKLFSRKFSSLSKSEQGKVYLEIVQSSARNRKAATKSANWKGSAGRTFLLLSLSIATYDVLQAKNKTKAVVYNGAVMAGSAGSGAAMGAAGGMICGPGAPLCVGIGVFVGGIMGAIGTQHLMNKTDISHYN